MTAYAIISNLSDMVTYPLESREISPAFDLFISNELVRPVDISIVSFVLDKLNIKANTVDELQVLEVYGNMLDQRDKTNLYNVNMDYWAYHNFL